jgi:hypothetical protein
MNWLALIGAAILVLAVAIWAVFRAALAKFSVASLQYPCLPRRAASTPPLARALDRRRRSLQRAKTMQEFRELAKPVGGAELTGKKGSPGRLG